MCYRAQVAETIGVDLRPFCGLRLLRHLSLSSGDDKLHARCLLKWGWKSICLLQHILQGLYFRGHAVSSANKVLNCKLEFKLPYSNQKGEQAIEAGVFRGCLQHKFAIREGLPEWDRAVGFKNGGRGVHSGSVRASCERRDSRKGDV